MPDRFTGKTALVTGASGGIGYELARLCARDGCRVVLVSRNQQKMEEVAGELTAKYKTESRVIVKDLSLPSSAAEVAATLRSAGVQIDILINNAGVGDYGFFAGSDIDRQTAMIRLNVTSLVILTRLLLPGMIERGWGRVMNVASTAAFFPGPLMAAYYASKAFVLSFSQALSNELSGSGVTVTTLCPGPTRSGFQKASGTENTYLMRSRLMMESPNVARSGYRAMVKGQAIVVPGVMNRVLVFSSRLGPRGLLTKIVRRLQESRVGAS